MAEIKVYGAPWCPDCKRAKKFLAEHRQPYEWIDIDDDVDGRRFVEELQTAVARFQPSSSRTAATSSSRPTRTSLASWA